MPSPLYRGDRSALVEQPTSPEYVFGEVVSMTRTYMGSAALCLSSAPMRGATGSGVATGFKVEESKVSRERGGMGKLVIKYVTDGQPAQGGQLPDSETSVEYDVIERPLELHSRYAALTTGQRTDIKTVLETSYENDDYQEAVARLIEDSLALELWEKRLSGFTYFQFFAPTFHLTQYSWDAPETFSAGGYREDPPDDLIDPPVGVDWLRMADRIQFNGTHWQLQSSWKGGPNLDTDVYP